MAKKTTLPFGAILLLGLWCHCGGKGTGTADSVPPAAVDDLAAGNPTHNSLTLTWTAPGDDSASGRAAQYDIRYSVSSITEWDWDSLRQVSGESSPKSASSAESFTITGLDDTTTYLFVIKTADEAFNWSTISNIAEGTTMPGTAATWQKTYGTTAPDGAKQVIPTPDGGYILAGQTRFTGSGDEDVYLLKLGLSGNVLWEKPFGGADVDDAASVALTPEGGYFIAGWTYTLGAGWDDVYLIKTDVSGKKVWDKTFGGSSNDRAYSVIPTADGGCIAAGRTRSSGAGLDDVYLIKTDASGNKDWEKTFGGADRDYGYWVASTADGRYVVAGGTRSFSAGESDVYLIKTDASGGTIWTRTYGGTGNDYGYCVVPTADGYIIVGSTNSSGFGNYDVYLIKTDASGDSVWAKTFGGVDRDHGYCVALTTDGGYIITGETSSSSAGQADVYLIKTDASGNVEWDKKFGGAEDDRGYSVALTDAGGYIIAGFTKSFGAGSSDVYLIKTNENGEL